MRPHGLVVACFVSVALAGCVGGEDAEPSADAAAGVLDEEDAGVVRGVVVDDEDRPVEGAEVAVIGLGSSNMTDASGRFELRPVPVGTHTLAVQALGYETSAQRVSVAAGQAVELFVRLSPIPVIDPYHESLIFDGHITCGLGLIVVTIVTGCGTTGTPVGNVTVDPNEKNEFDQIGRPELAMVVGELVWTQAAALAARELDLDLYQGWVCTPFCSTDHNYGGQAGPSPVVLRSEGFDGLKDGPAEIEHLVSVAASESDPPFVIVVIQQDFTLYSTHFFGLPAPEDFAARPDA